MRIGVNPGYLGGVVTPAEELAFARAAERRGYATYWVGEPYGHDAASVLGFVAGHTTTIGLGTAIMVIPGRTPAMTGQTAATVDWLSGGRLHLGLGLSGPQVSEGWHGVPFARPLDRTRDHVAIVRQVVARETVAYQGATVTVPLPGGAGKPLKLILQPPRREIPIHLAALAHRNLELVGEVADGWIPLWFSPEHAASSLASVAAGAERVGRDPTTITTTPMVPVRFDDDVAVARDVLRPMVALYVGGMGARGRNFYTRLVASYGFEAQATEVQDHYLAGRHAEAIAAVPDALVDATCLVGPVERVADRLQAYAAVGVSEVMAVPAALLAEDRQQQLDLFAEAAAASGVCV